MSREAELESTIAALLKKPEMVKSIRKAIDTWASMQPHEMELKFRMLHLSYAFSVVILIGVIALAYWKLITSEVTAGLLGSLLGYWYGQSKKSN